MPISPVCRFTHKIIERKKCLNVDVVKFFCFLLCFDGCAMLFNKPRHPPSIINSFSKKKILYHYYYYYYRSILLFLAICITRVWSIQYNIVPPPSSSSILNWSWHHRYSCVFNWPLFTFSKDYPGSLL